MQKKDVNSSDIQGLTKIEALVFLGSKGFSATEAQEFYTENKPMRVGFTAIFYSELEKGPMDDEAFEAILKTGSDNTRRHRSHFDGVRRLANAIHAAKK